MGPCSGKRGGLFNIMAFFLLFVDDMVILRDNPEGFQSSSDKLYYSMRWGLKVNTKKSKIVVFLKRGTLLCISSM